VNPFDCYANITKAERLLRENDIRLAREADPVLRRGMEVSRFELVANLEAFESSLHRHYLEAELPPARRQRLGIVIRRTRDVLWREQSKAGRA
jgi:hypothetical protein